MAILAVIAGAAYGCRALLSSFTTRQIQVCALTDFDFRDQRPDWERLLNVWFTEVNRTFQAAGVQWNVKIGGDAYPERTERSLADRRRMVAETQCKADVVLAFTGQADRDSNASVVPFGHAAIIALSAGDSDTMAVTVVSRGLAKLFGSRLGVNTAVLADAPDAGAIDDATLELVRSLRGYDFAAGVDALSGKWEQRALKALERNSPGGPLSPAAQARVTLARAFALSLRHDRAVAHLREAVRLYPGDPSLRFELAMELAADSETEEAVTELREVAKRDPDDARPHAAMGAIFLNARRTDEAIDELRAAVKLEPRNAGYVSTLGQALSQQPGNLQEAAAAFEAALRLRPSDVGAQHGTDLIGSDKDLTRNLISEMQAEVRREQSSAEAHLRLGLAYATAGDRERARVEIRRSIELDGSNAHARLALARVEYLLGNYRDAEAAVQQAQTLGLPASMDLMNAIRRKLAASQ